MEYLIGYCIGFVVCFGLFIWLSALEVKRTKKPMKGDDFYGLLMITAVWPLALIPVLLLESKDAILRVINKGAKV